MIPDEVKTLNKRGLLIVISGFSGSGKGTVVKELVDRYGYNVSISATTRKPRDYETEGVEYFFVTKEEFENKISENGFIEHAQFVGNYYGTPKDYVESMLADGKDVILEIEVQGGLQVKEQYPDTVMIFLAPPDAEELKMRLEGRGTESSDVILKRLERAKQEIAYIDRYDYFVINDDLNECVDNIHNILSYEKKKLIYNKYVIDELKEDFDKQLSKMKGD